MENLPALITDVGSVVSGAVGWVGTVLGTIRENAELFLFCIGFPAAGYGVGYLKRLFRA